MGSPRPAGAARSPRLRPGPEHGGTGGALRPCGRQVEPERGPLPTPCRGERGGRGRAPERLDVPRGVVQRLPRLRRGVAPDDPQPDRPPPPDAGAERHAPPAPPPSRRPRGRAATDLRAPFTR